jgi:glycosyltransferase involved in cell wall biosynthesis
LRFLGIKIHGGYTSEAKVFSALLGHRRNAYDARVIYHVWPGENGAELFERDSQATLEKSDFALRPNLGEGRGPVEKLAAFTRFRTLFPAALRRARAYAPDVIYSSQQLWDCALATYIAQRLGKPHVMHLHFVVGTWLKTGFSETPGVVGAINAVLGFADPVARLKECAHVVAISDYIWKDAVQNGIAPDRVTTIRNTMTLFPPPAPCTREAVRREFGLPEDAPILGIVGRVDPGKGQEDTLAAFARIAPAFPDAHLLIVGNGTIEAKVQAQAAKAGLEKRVLFTGKRADVPRLLAAMDIFSHPSRREPFGLAITEAASAGLPVVAYAEGGVSEIVQDGVTGLLVTPGSTEELADSLARLLANPETARRMGAAGRQRIATAFRPEEAGQAFAALLRKAVADSSRSRPDHLQPGTDPKSP